MRDEQRTRQHSRADRPNKPQWKSFINIGTVVFILIVLYLMGNVFRYFSKQKLAVYEVSNSEISDSISGTGIILRTEKVYQTEEDGYVNTYLSDGARVKAKGIVYTLDKTGMIQEEVNKLIAENNGNNAEELEKIREDLSSFVESYNDADYYVVSETKNKVDHDLLSYTSTLLSKNKSEFEKKYGEDCYIEVRSTQSGLVSYSSDGLEETTLDTLSKDLFKNKVHMQDLRSKEETKAGSNVYRLTTSQIWQIAIPLSEDDYGRIKNLYDNEVAEAAEEGKTTTPTMKINIEKDDFTTTVPYTYMEKDGQGYVVLTFKNYVQRYLNQRFLSVELMLIKGSGLKIPASSLVEKKVFRIPKDYLWEGSNDEGNNHVSLIYKDKKGREKARQITVKIIEEDDDMVVIYSTELKVGDRIKRTNDASTYSLDKTETLYGVYTVNSGYAVFNYVKINERNEDYCIVDADNSEIELYDRIILNSDSIHENDIIY